MTEHKPLEHLMLTIGECCDPVLHVLFREFDDGIAELRIEYATHQSKQGFGLKWLLDEVEGPAADRLDCKGNVGVTGDYNHRAIIRPQPQLPQQRNSIHTWHSHVGHDTTSFSV